MAWTRFTDPKGTVWVIDYQNVANVIKGYAHIVALSENVRIETEGSLADILPGSFGLAKSNILQYDEKDVRNRASEITQKMYQAFLAMLTTADGRDPENFLANLRTKTIRLRNEHGGLVEKSNKMNQDFMASIDRSIEVAKGTRDTSVLLLTCIASVASGGTAAVAASVATGTTALAKYQDTGSAAEAAKAGVGCLITLGWGQLASYTKGMKVAEKAIFFSLGAVVDFSTNMSMNSSDKQFGDAVESAAWTTLRNAGFFWMDIGLQKAMSRDIGIAATKCGDLVRFMYQSTGRLFEKAVLEDMAKRETGRQAPRGGHHAAHDVPHVATQEAQNFVRKTCIYRD